MTPAASTAPLSRRFVGAAQSERKRLEARRDRLTLKRDRIDEEIESISQKLERVSVFAEAVEPEDVSPVGPVLRGRLIADVAVAVLALERGSSPIHYREWLGLLAARGLRVAGVRPETVFWGQVARHPDVRPATSRGYFNLGSETVADHRRRGRGLLASLATSAREA